MSHFDNLKAIRTNSFFITFSLTAISFWILTRGHILSPSNIEWLMQGETDGATYWISWHFFRHTPLLQWPLGANPDYGQEISSSIVFSDTIPLLAFVFKPLNALLPEIFQYFGLWIFICFFLQLFFARKILLHLTGDKCFATLAGLFFVFAPLFLDILHGHYGLLAHWTLLAGLSLYFSKVFARFWWLALLAATVLIHGYLFVMVAAIWATDLGQRYFKRQLALKNMAFDGLAGIASVVLVMLAAGYFTIRGEGVAARGFGAFRLDLATLFIPARDKWSMLIPADMELAGFSFLGLGMIGLVAVALFLLVKNKGLQINKQILFPLLVLSFLLTAYAVSNNIVIAGHELFSYPPALLKKVIKVFRMTARFFWPVYYIAYLGVFYVIYKSLKRNAAIACCSVFLLVQAVDLAGAIAFFNKKFTTWAEWESPMRSALWKNIGQCYKRIIYVLPANEPPSWAPLSHFAATHKMPINVAYYARISEKKLSEARQQLLKEIFKGEFHQDALYVFTDKRLWQMAAEKTKNGDMVGELDGFKFIAPKLKLCKDCDLAAIDTYQGNGKSSFAYDMQPILFNDAENIKKYVLFGLRKAESWGAWSTGNRIAVLLRLSNTEDRPLDLLITGHAFLERKRPPRQLVKVYANGLQAGILVYDEADQWKLKTIRIPAGTVAMPDGHLLLEFKIDKPVSPAEHSLNMDGRLLGLGLISLQVSEAN